MGIEALVLGGLASSAVGAVSANKQAKAGAKAARRADDTQRYMYDRSVELSEPWRRVGMNALAGVESLAGIGAPAGIGGEDGIYWADQNGNYRDMIGTDMPFGERDGWTKHREVSLEGDPGYQFRLQQGQKALEQNAAARGLRMSSNTMKAMTDYNQGMASQEFGNMYNRLAGLAGVGQAATSQQINAGQNYANAAGQNALAAGAARASGYAGVNNAVQGGINNMFNIAGMAGAGMFGSNPTLFGQPIGIGG